LFEDEEVEELDDQKFNNEKVDSLLTVDTLNEIEDEKIEISIPEAPKNEIVVDEEEEFESGFKIIRNEQIQTENDEDIEEEPAPLVSAYVEDDEEELQIKFEEQTKLELAEVLEHKNMTKIIEVVFDYDIEDFANMLDEISNCRNVEDAHYIINETLATRRINRNSKEADTLREIISEYFSRR